MNKPPWLKPNTLVVHDPSEVLFVLKKLQMQRGEGKGELLLLDCDEVPLTVAGETEPYIFRYPLSECRPAQWADVEGEDVAIYENGVRRSLSRPDRQLAQVPIEESQNNEYRLEPDPVYDAAQSLAAFMGFGSEVLEPLEARQNLPQWR